MTGAYSSAPVATFATSTAVTTNPCRERRDACQPSPAPSSRILPPVGSNGMAIANSALRMACANSLGIRVRVFYEHKFIATQAPGKRLVLQCKSASGQFAHDICRFGDLERVSAQPIPPVVKQRHSTFLRVLACVGARHTKVSQVLPQRVRSE